MFVAEWANDQSLLIDSILSTSRVVLKEMMTVESVHIGCTTREAGRLIVGYPDHGCRCI